MASVVHPSTGRGGRVGAAGVGSTGDRAREVGGAGRVGGGDGVGIGGGDEVGVGDGIGEAGEDNAVLRTGGVVQRCARRSDPARRMVAHGVGGDGGGKAGVIGAVLSVGEIVLCHVCRSGFTGSIAGGRGGSVGPVVGG